MNTDDLTFGAQRNEMVKRQMEMFDASVVIDKEISGMETDEVMRNLMEILQRMEAAELHGVALRLEIDIPADRTGDVYFMLRRVNRFLMSEEVEALEDGGRSIIVAVYRANKFYGLDSGSHESPIPRNTCFSTGAD